MIVAVSFVGGRVHLRTRFVMSKHRAHEKEERKYLYRGQMGTHPNGIIKDTAILLKNLLTLRWPTLHYRNPSNTNVFYWGGKVTLSETVYCIYNASIMDGVVEWQGANLVNLHESSEMLNIV